MGFTKVLLKHTGESVTSRQLPDEKHGELNAPWWQDGGRSACSSTNSLFKVVILEFCSSLDLNLFL
ncbi:hypothetical protein EYF80_061611 [Liparis tanakae]|uniref:Uncharacterized protein n=1 Tax=Liparis tanakae TaxID=230148 RepID=A0A4Z2EHF7_9TELE|nr:hypothetical protein EYF80_061611 [Liparis tanakae]